MFYIYAVKRIEDEKIFIGEEIIHIADEKSLFGVEDLKNKFNFAVEILYLESFIDPDKAKERKKELKLFEDTYGKLKDVDTF